MQASLHTGIRFPSPDVCRSVELELDKAMKDSDPCSVDAVAAALARSPTETLEATKRLRALGGQGLLGFLAPVIGADPDPGAAMEIGRQALAASQREPRQHIKERPRRLRQSGGEFANRVGEEIGCSCGFTCGTREALQRHIARFSQDDPAHCGFVLPT